MLIIILYANTTGGGDDYVSGPFSVIIPAGRTRASFDVPIINDTTQEDNERFRLTIDRASLVYCIFIGRPMRATVIIVDDECK